MMIVVVVMVCDVESIITMLLLFVF
jgi:hypothetical protein